MNKYNERSPELPALQDASVFELKKHLIIKEIYNDGIFEECAACVYRIEFQKCGLLHLPMLIF
jgi:hypothetical protein